LRFIVCFLPCFFFFFERLQESYKSAIPTNLYGERAFKLWASQTVVEELLEELQAEQQNLSMEANPFQERSKAHVKTKVKKEHKVAPKSLFHGTSLATSTSVMDTSVHSESSETSQNDD
jgi:hypothetical protein